LKTNLIYADTKSRRGFKVIQFCKSLDSLLNSENTIIQDYGLGLNLFYESTRGFETRFISDTYDDLNNSGKYSLIRNQQITKALNDFYQTKTLQNRNHFSLNDIEPYRSLVRREIPFKIKFKLKE